MSEPKVTARPYTCQCASGTTWCTRSDGELRRIPCVARAGDVIATVTDVVDCRDSSEPTRRNDHALTEATE